MPDSLRFLGSDGAFLGLFSSYTSPSPRMPPSPPPLLHTEVCGNGQICDPPSKDSSLPPSLSSRQIALF